jgi:hypothetical protein
LIYFYTKIYELWGQQHPKTSGMEKHLHGQNLKLCGFYIIDAPEESMNMIIDDPRDVKVYAGLPEKDNSIVSSATNSVFYTPKQGDFFFMESWLAHSFTRNRSSQNFNFIHFNIGVVNKELEQPTIV